MPFVCNAYNSVDTNMKICTGRWFCKEREGIEPDIMTVGKAIGAVFQ